VRNPEFSELLGNEISDQRSKQIARLSVLVIGVISTTIAALDLSLVLQLVAFAWGGLGATFGPAIFTALWWRGVTSQGIVVGMVVGMTATIVGFVYVGNFHPVLITWNIWPMVLSFASIYGVSKYTQSRAQQERHVRQLSSTEGAIAENDD
jgi:Na+/proline symporter